MKDIRGQTLGLGDLVVFTPTDRYGESTFGRVVRIGPKQIQIANKGTRSYCLGRKAYSLSPMRRTHERVVVLEHAPEHIKQQLQQWCNTKSKNRQQLHVEAGMTEADFADWTDTWAGAPQ